MSHDVKKAYEVIFIQLHSSDLIHLMKTCKPTTINVFLALHIRANRKAGNTCFPSLSTIADDANVSRRTVVNAIEELESVGLVTVEKRMDDAGDQTSNLYWLHRKSESAQGSAGSAPQVVQDLHQGVVQNLHPNHMNSFNTDEIELNSSDDENNTNDGAETPARTSNTARDRFDAWYATYPRKVGKQAALASFMRHATSVPLDTLLRAVERQKKSSQWQKDGGQFIPNPSTWLNQGRWDDELPTGDSQSQLPVNMRVNNDRELSDEDWLGSYAKKGA